MTYDELAAMAEELAAAGRLSNDEFGEWWQLLSEMWPMVTTMGSIEFERAYEAELISEHKQFKDHYRIIETTETQTVTVRKLQHESEYE
tara:strand:+ start:213 stop:479 length:267 start_codon:yes stop_codon:yes gene_type:complete